MPSTKIGLNLTNLQNVTAPSFDFKNTTEQFLNDIPNKANSITEGFYGLIVLSALFGWLIWKLSEMEISGGAFGYSYTRSIGIASGICSVIGLFCLNMGYFSNFYHVVIFIATTFIMAGVVWKTER